MLLSFAPIYVHVLLKIQTAGMRLVLAVLPFDSPSVVPLVEGFGCSWPQQTCIVPPATVAEHACWVCQIGTYAYVRMQRHLVVIYNQLSGSCLHLRLKS